MNFYAVLDTNVLVSAFLKSESIPGLILVEALYGRIKPLLCNEIVEEYKGVLGRSKFKFDQNYVGDILSKLIARSLAPGKVEIADPMPDPKDAIFYQVVLAGRREGEAYLVTGNLKHFPTQSFAVSPREMLDLLEKTADVSPM